MNYLRNALRRGNVFVFGTGLTLPVLFEIMVKYDLSLSDKQVLIDWTYSYLLSKLNIAYYRHITPYFPLPITIMPLEQRHLFLNEIKTLEQGIWYTLGGSLPDGVYEIDFCAVRNNDLYLVW